MPFRGYRRHGMPVQVTGAVPHNLGVISHHAIRLGLSSGLTVRLDEKTLGALGVVPHHLEVISVPISRSGNTEAGVVSLKLGVMNPHPHIIGVSVKPSGFLHRYRGSSAASRRVLGQACRQARPNRHPKGGCQLRSGGEAADTG